MTCLLKNQTCDYRDQAKYFFGFISSLMYHMKRNLHHIEVFQNMHVILLYKNKAFINLAGKISHDFRYKFG
jgi:hypothetical protein